MAPIYHTMHAYDSSFPQFVPAASWHVKNSIYLCTAVSIQYTLLVNLHV